MSKLKKISTILVVLLIIALIIIVWKSIAYETELDINNKTLSEIKYFESKIVCLFNALNNIEFENYKISSESISEKSQNSSNGSENDSESSNNSEDNEVGKKSQSSNDDIKNSKNPKFSLNAKGILNNKEQINWNYIKNEAELLENTISTLTLDLYQISLNNNEIIEFSNDYDKLLINIKNEDKEKTLDALNNLYNYLPIFVKYCNKDEQFNIIVNTKSSIYKAYSLLDFNDWDSIEKKLLDASKKFSSLLTDISFQNINQYTVNKCYISLNRLVKSVKEKDIELFLIKYKNLLEDLNSL